MHDFFSSYGRTSFYVRMARKSAGSSFITRSFYFSLRSLLGWSTIFSSEVAATLFLCWLRI